MNKKICLFLFCILLSSCIKHLDNKYDTTNASYWANTYIFSVLVPKQLKPAPTVFSYTPNDFAFIVGESYTSKTGFSTQINGTIDSVIASPALPAGIRFGSNWTIVPNSPQTSQAQTKYIITACNSFGCMSTDVLIQIVNTIGNFVWGQFGQFTTSITNANGVSANSLSTPRGLALDSSGGLYIADTVNNRVLYYTAGSSTASRVYGQLGSFTSNVADNGGISANSLNFPSSVAVDSNDGLYIGDYLRILYYPAGRTTATVVYGQGGSFTTRNGSGISASTFSAQTGLAVDANDNLYVTDPNNSRVLFFPAGSTVATRVYGQRGNFTTNSANQFSNTMDNLSNPYCVFAHSSGTVYICDSGNSRVLSYESNQTTASASLTYNVSSLDRLYGFTGIYVDSKKGIYVTYPANYSVYYFASMQSTALKFSIGGTDLNGVTTKSMSSNPYSVILDKNGNIYISDSGFNRVIKYNQ